VTHFENDSSSSSAFRDAHEIDRVSSRPLASDGYIAQTEHYRSSSSAFGDAHRTNSTPSPPSTSDIDVWERMLGDRRLETSSYTTQPLAQETHIEHDGSSSAFRDEHEIDSVSSPPLASDIGMWEGMLGDRRLETSSHTPQPSAQDGDISSQPAVETTSVPTTRMANMLDTMFSDLRPSTREANESTPVCTDIASGSTVVESDNDATCVICLTAAPTHAFLPCGHRCTCGPCGSRIMTHRAKVCPVCRAEAIQIVRIFI